MHNQQVIDFGNNPKVYDNRKIGVAFVCFEDQLMNHSSDLRFSTTTSNWRNLQSALMGDYGGSLEPEPILARLEKIKSFIQLKALSESDPIDKIFLRYYNIENGTLLIEKLEKIANAALVAGTKVRIMNGQFIGSL